MRLVVETWDAKIYEVTGMYDAEDRETTDLNSVVSCIFADDHGHQWAVPIDPSAIHPVH